MKKLKIEKTKPTFSISTFKTDIVKVGLVFSISNFFIAKRSLANNWRSFSSSYLALVNIAYPISNLTSKIIWIHCEGRNFHENKLHPKVALLLQTK